MRRRVIGVFLAVAIMTFAAVFSAEAAQEEAAPGIKTGGGTTPVTTASTGPLGWLDRDTLTGDWGGGRTWLKEHGITLKPRFTQFYQGLTAGEVMSRLYLRNHARHSPADPRGRGSRRQWRDLN